MKIFENKFYYDIKFLQSYIMLGKRSLGGMAGM